MSSKPPNNMSKLPALPADAPALASGRDDTTSHVSKACPMARWSQSSVSSGASSASTALMTPGASSSSSSDHLPSVPPLDANALGCGSLDCITEEDGSATAVAAPSGATVDPYGVGPHRTPTATTPTPTPAPTSASPDQQLITALENLSTDRGRQDSRAAPARHALRTGTDRQQRSAGLGFDRELAALEGIVEQLDPTSISSDEGSGSGSGSGSIRSKASPPILAQDKNLGITIYDLTAQISMPVSRSSSWSGVSRTSEVEEDARRPAWAKPVVEQDNIGGNLEQVIIQGLEIQQDFGEGVFHLEPDTDITATPDLTQHALKGSDGRIMVKTDDKQHVVCCWLPGIPYVHSAPPRSHGSDDRDGG